MDVVLLSAETVEIAGEMGKKPHKKVVTVHYH